nr:glycosyltransferase family A protein [uncultured Vibrio sp.]
MNTNTRPLMSFVLLAYNQEEYIEEAIKGAFSQTYSPLEIILSDDCSPDGTFAMMEKMAKAYNGPHTVILNKNETNLGLGLHVNKAFGMARGNIIIAAAGDDISFANRAEETYKIFSKNKDIFSVSSQPLLINKQGHTLGVVEETNVEDEYTIASLLKGHEYPIHGCTRAYIKDVLTKFPPLEKNCPAEDVVLLFRAVLLGGTIHKNSAFVKYRILNNSLASTIDINAAHLLYEQKIKDLNVAVDSNLISADIAKLIAKRVDETLISTVKYQQLLRTKFHFPFFIFNILFKKDITRRKKKFLFVESVRLSTPSVIKKLLKFVFK